MQTEMVGRNYGTVMGTKLIARRPPNYHLYESVKTFGVKEQLVLITDKGRFLSSPNFVGDDYFTIIGALWIDEINQTMRKYGGKFPIIVQPGTIVEFLQEKVAA